MNYFSGKYVTRAEHAADDLVKTTKKNILEPERVTASYEEGTLSMSFSGVDGTFSGKAVDEINEVVERHKRNFNEDFYCVHSKALTKRDKLIKE